MDSRTPDGGSPGLHGHTPADPEAVDDLDAPAPTRPSQPSGIRRRRSGGLVVTGVVLLALQQVLAPTLNAYLYNTAGPSQGAAHALTYVVIAVLLFSAGLSCLAVGLYRLASHVDALVADSEALRRSLSSGEGALRPE